MKIKFYGTRGSIATPSTEDAKTDLFGGNTTCILVGSKEGANHIIDAGSGIRNLGLDLLRDGADSAHLYLTHLHGDHIDGLPFFNPAYSKDMRINVISGSERGRKHFRKVLEERQNYRNFPVPLSALSALRNFWEIRPGEEIETGSLQVETCKLNHPGGCNAYKFKEGNSSIVVSTDFEPDEKGRADALVELIKGADVWVADGQYEIGSKRNPFMKGWGHSDPFWDAKVAIAYGVKNLIVTHHDPRMDDVALADLENRLAVFSENEAKRKEVKDFRVYLAREGASLDLKDGIYTIREPAINLARAKPAKINESPKTKFDRKLVAYVEDKMK